MEGSFFYLGGNGGIMCLVLEGMIVIGNWIGFEMSGCVGNFIVCICGMVGCFV